MLSMEPVYPVNQLPAVSKHSLSCFFFSSSLVLPADGNASLCVSVSVSPADVHRKRGHLHKPLQVAFHLHPRQSGGIPQPELLRAQPPHVSFTPPPKKSLLCPGFVWVLFRYQDATKKKNKQNNKEGSCFEGLMSRRNVKRRPGRLAHHLFGQKCQDVENTQACTMPGLDAPSAA